MAFERGPVSWCDIAFGASAGAAAIHFGAVHSHLAEYRPAGLFMLASGICQFVWAVWVARGTPRSAATAGLHGNAWIVMLWFLSRTAGLPFGMQPGVPEHIHSTDALATALEVLTITSCWMLRSEAAPPSGVLTRLTVAATVLAALVTSHEPSRERLVATAALALACVVRLFVARLTRRNDVQPAYAVRVPVRLRFAAGPGRGAR